MAILPDIKDLLESEKFTRTHMGLLLVIAVSMCGVVGVLWGCSSQIEKLQPHWQVSIILGAIALILLFAIIGMQLSKSKNIQYKDITPSLSDITKKALTIVDQNKHGTTILGAIDTGLVPMRNFCIPDAIQYGSDIEIISWDISPWREHQKHHVIEVGKCQETTGCELVNKVMKASVDRGNRSTAPYELITRHILLPQKITDEDVDTIKHIASLHREKLIQERINNIVYFDEKKEPNVTIAMDGRSAQYYIKQCVFFSLPQAGTGKKLHYIFAVVSQTNDNQISSLIASNNAKDSTNYTEIRDKILKRLASIGVKINGLADTEQINKADAVLKCLHFIKNSSHEEIQSFLSIVRDQTETSASLDVLASSVVKQKGAISTLLSLLEVLRNEQLVVNLLELIRSLQAASPNSPLLEDDKKAGTP